MAQAGNNAMTHDGVMAAAFTPTSSHATNPKKVHPLGGASHKAAWPQMVLRRPHAPEFRPSNAPCRLYERLTLNTATWH